MAAAAAVERITPAAAVARADRAKRLKDNWRSLLSDAYEYALPQRNLYWGGDEADPGAIAGQKKVDRVFDSTAPNAVISFANRIQADMMQPFTRWLKLEAGPMVPAKMRPKVNKLLEMITDQFFAVLQASNFDLANNECLLDLAVGTASMLILEGDVNRPVMYVAVPAPQVCLEEGPWGTVSGVYRTHSLEIVNIRRQWPDIKEGALPQTIRDKLKDPEKCMDKVLLVECSYPAGESGAWCYDVILKSEKERILARTYHESPWVTPRWIKVAGEPYGRGPVIQALPDIKTINKVRELILRNAALYVSGVYTGVDDGVLNPNTVAIRPGTVIPVASNGGTRGPSLQALERSGDFQLAQFEHEQLQMHIKQILLDNRLPADSASVRSATEIIERVKELAKDVGSPFSRLLQEYIVPIVQRTLNIMERRKLIPPVKVDGLAVQVRVVSPLAQEQNLNDVANVIRWLQILGQLGPEMMHLAAKTEDVGDYIGDKMGVPQQLRRSKDERDEMQASIGKVVGERLAQGGAIPIGKNGNVVPISKAGGASAGGMKMAA